MLPLFVPPLVAGVAWCILGSPKTGLLNTMFKWAGLDWRFDFYSMWGLIFVFGIYYAPYVYMFTASALRNMDPSLEEAAEVSGASAFATLFTVTFPLIVPAIVSGMLLSFVVMLGIYGIPGGARRADQHPRAHHLHLQAHQLVAAALQHRGRGRDHPDGRHRRPGVGCSRSVLSGRSYTTVAGKAFRPRNLNLGPLALVHLRPRASSICSSWSCCRRSR